MWNTSQILFIKKMQGLEKHNFMKMLNKKLVRNYLLQS